MNKQILDAPFSPKKNDSITKIAFFSLSILFFITSFIGLYFQYNYGGTENYLIGGGYLMIHYTLFFVLRAFLFRDFLKKDDNIHLPTWKKKDVYGVTLVTDTLSFRRTLIARIMFYFLFFPLFFIFITLVTQALFLMLLYLIFNNITVIFIVAYILNATIWFLMLLWEGLMVLKEQKS